ncbi:hypothetical protein [Marasmitruncus massiliensis]|uniref:hypothetical protein n=1 Tax=Marasmitruncus massiliensis TaxID=1944642 RepID=UPI000C796196|nr:hypothetical protein [Marasmitruncus massiliensis]
MRKFLWINPVASEMYGTPELKEELAKKGFEIVTCRQDHIAAVKKKYRLAIETAHTCVADMRCPMAVSYIKKTYAPDFLEYPDIEPILMHCARELHERLSGKGFLYITTPCTALRELGNSIGLPKVRFYTWAEFAQLEGIPLRRKILDISPIPPGFFAEYGKQAGVLDSREKIDLHFSSLPKPTEKKVLELLYCPRGCHNGDGV